MGLLNRKRPADQIQASRQRILEYKKFFSSPEGREVIYDLMNRYHILETHNGDALKEGQRSVILYILKQANIDMVQYDKILKGEFNG